MWVDISDEVVFDAFGPCAPPSNRLVVGESLAWGGPSAWEPYSAHTQSGCVVMANRYRWEWNELGNAARACCDVMVHPLEVVEGIMDALLRGNSSSGFVCEGFLHGAKNISGTWKG